MNFAYRSVADLNRDIRQWLSAFPRDCELVVGVPRSGLLVATLLALHLNIPLTDLEGLLEGRLISAGKRLEPPKPDFLASPRRVVVLDDTVNSGRQLRLAKEAIRDRGLAHEIRYAAVYVTPEHEHEVDLYFANIAKGRVFEWNLFHSRTLGRCCVDIDGVLCRDPTEAENDDGERYRGFLETVAPRIVPTQPIGWLVTTRLERYRPATEAWLARHGIQYGRLIMLDLPDAAERRRIKPYAAFKAAAYRDTGAELFIESSLTQATEIARLTSDYVLCTDSNSMIEPGALAAGYRKVQRFGRYRLPDLVQSARKRLRRALGVREVTRRSS
jgi:orotate phosphoribosyltransferase